MKNRQYDLLDCGVKSVDPQPSEDAALVMKPTAERHRERILSVLKGEVHMSNGEIAVQTSQLEGESLNRIQVTRRVSEMERRGLIERRIGMCPILKKMVSKWRRI